MQARACLPSTNATSGCRASSIFHSLSGPSLSTNLQSAACALFILHHEYWLVCWCAKTGATVTLEGGQKFYGRFVVLADGVHSKTAAKHHKAKSEFQNVVGWRCATQPLLPSLLWLAKKLPWSCTFHACLLRQPFVLSASYLLPLFKHSACMSVYELCCPP